MRSISKILTVLLLAGLAWAQPAELLSRRETASSRLAGCHHQRRQQPPQSTDYACCQLGHRAAVLPQTFSIAPAAVVGLAGEPKHDVLSVVTSVANLPNANNSPPLCALRI